MRDALADIVAERARQVDVEGWTAEHDDAHDVGQLAFAAACYAVSDYSLMVRPFYTALWPWEMKWWKPKGRRLDLVRAGALILAEIERLDRAEAAAR